MTTADVERLANKEGIGDGILTTLLEMHRREVIPDFLGDCDVKCGRVGWRRRAGTIAIVVGTPEYDLPTDFSKFELAQLYTAGNIASSSFKNIGEDPELVLELESATTPGPPSGFYFVPSITGDQRRIRIASTDAAYTVRYTYYRRIPYTNLTSAIDLDPYIPADLQRGLVKKLRMWLFKDRLGIKDGRYVAESDEYDKFWDTAEYHKESAPREHAVFAR